MNSLRIICLALLIAAFAARAAVYQETEGRVVVEAEHFDSRTQHEHADGQHHHWHISPADDGVDFLFDVADFFASARGSSYIQVLPNGAGGGDPNEDPKALYKVNIQTPGTYQLWLRWVGATGSDNSLYASVATLVDGPGGTHADWYRFSKDGALDFANGWQGTGGFERTDASGGDTPATWEISTPGVYTVMITQREDGAALDTILLQLTSLAPPGEPGPAESAISTSFPPSVSSFTPSGSAVPPGTPIKIEITAGGSVQVAPDSIRIILNDSDLDVSSETSAGVTTATATPSILPSQSTNEVVLIFSDTASPANFFTNRFEFVVADYMTLSASLPYPISSADSTAPGFRARVVQANTFSGTLPNTIARAEAQLAGTLIDPLTAQPYANEANQTGVGPDGYFVDSDVINWNQDAGGFEEQGNFRAPENPDEPIPGIPGIDGFNTDNIAAEILTFLELKVGAYTLGVNSDDGFSVGVAPDARDVFRTTLGEFNDGRGSADTIFSFVAEVDGLYPFRLLWFEGEGGANLEFFSVDAASGDKILINDRDDPRAIKAWRRSTAPSRPYISSVSPLPNSADVALDSSIEFVFVNGALTLDTSSVEVRLNGEVVPVSTTTVGADGVRVVADPPGNLNQTTDYEVVLSYQDSGDTSVTHEFTFSTIRAPINLPPLRQDEAGFVVIEAENFDLNTPQGVHSWVFVRSPAGYSGDGTMYALPDEPVAVIEYPDSLTLSPRLDYKVEFTTTGTHYFWFRGSDGGGDSLHAGIDGDSPFNGTMNRIDEGCCGDRAVGGVSFTWVGGSSIAGRSQFDVTQAGLHTINVWMREDGQIIDKVIITTDPNYIPTGAGPEESSRVGDPFPPIVTISSPAEGATFPAGGAVTITADADDQDGTVNKVEFFANGEKIGEDTSAPFSLQFTPSVERPYVLTARATDNTGLTGESAGVKIISGNPPQVLYLGNNPLSQAGDLVIINHLENRGFLVTAIDDDASQTTDAEGKVLVVISSTVGSGSVNIKFTDVAIPIINWEEALFDDLKMTGDSGSAPDHHGSTGGQTEIQILDPTHPLAAGLSGTQTVTSSPQTMSWGYLEITPTDAVPVATVGGNPQQWAIWAYEKGDALYDTLPAPEKRVGFFFNGGSPTANTSEATRLFDAAVNWALGIVDEPAPELSISKQGSNQVQISWTGGGILESSTNLGDPNSWSAVPGAGSPQHTVDATDAHRFFRVRK